MTRIRIHKKLQKINYKVAILNNLIVFQKIKTKMFVEELKKSTERQFVFI